MRSADRRRSELCKSQADVVEAVQPGWRVKRLGGAMGGHARAWAITGCLMGLLTAPGFAQVPEGAALATQEDHPTRTLPEPPSHWVYILEPVFPHLIASKIWILDGDTLQFQGMASAG